jgi:hypothetical protein
MSALSDIGAGLVHHDPLDLSVSVQLDGCPALLRESEGKSYVFEGASHTYAPASRRV